MKRSSPLLFDAGRGDVSTHTGQRIKSRQELITQTYQYSQGSPGQTIIGQQFLHTVTKLFTKIIILGFQKVLDHCKAKLVRTAVEQHPQYSYQQIICWIVWVLLRKNYEKSRSKPFPIRQITKWTVSQVVAHQTTVRKFPSSILHSPSHFLSLFLSFPCSF